MQVELNTIEVVTVKEALELLKSEHDGNAIVEAVIKELESKLGFE
jgi:hypothetical protein